MGEPPGILDDDRWHVIARHDWTSEESLVVTLLRALSDNPANEPPLYDSVDAEALRRLLDAAHAGGTVVGVRFTWSGQEVTVDSDGRIAVRDADDAET